MINELSSRRIPACNLEKGTWLRLTIRRQVFWPFGISRRNKVRNKRANQNGNVNRQKAKYCLLKFKSIQISQITTYC